MGLYDTQFLRHRQRTKEQNREPETEAPPFLHLHLPSSDDSVRRVFEPTWIKRTVALIKMPMKAFNTTRASRSSADQLPRSSASRNLAGNSQALRAFQHPVIR